MYDSSSTHITASPDLHRFVRRINAASLPVVAALLLCFGVACGGGGGGGGSSAPATATGSGSGTSTSGTGTGTGTSSGEGGSPQGNAAPPRTYAVRFLPSPSDDIQGYDLLIGESSGSYDSRVDIQVSEATEVGLGVLSYDVELESDKTYFMVLRAYDTLAMSPPSNEITVAAVPTTSAAPAEGEAEGGSAVHSPAVVSGSSADLMEDGTIADSGSTPAPADDGNEGGEELADERASVSDGMASLDFGGAGEHLASASAAELGSAHLFTVSMWARPAADEAPRRVLLDVREESGGNANRMTLALVNSADLELTLHGVTGAVLHRARFAQAIADGVWQHLAVVFDAQSDLEPSFFVDAELQQAAASSSEAGIWAIVDSVRRVFVGAEAGIGAGASFLGQLGHAAIWAQALNVEALDELSVRGHNIDLRDASGAYESQDDLLHYWRLGDDSNGLGFDYGRASVPIDLDESGTGIDEADIVSDAPQELSE